LCKADFITDHLSERVFMSDPANNSFFSNDPVGEDLFQFNTGSEKASPPSPTVSPALAQGPLPIYQPGQEPQGSAVPSQQQPQTSAGYYDPNQSSVAIPKTSATLRLVTFREVKIRFEGDLVKSF
jgi:hypothetical protein